MRGRASRGLVAALAALVWFGLALAPAGLAPARAAEYSMATEASYLVAAADRRVDVMVDVTFENTTPDPDGQFSLFEVVDLALHPGATGVSASDSQGALNVSVAARDGFTLASVRPRQGVRYQQRATFTLRYALPDGAAPGVRIRDSLIAFPVWSFGTRGTVSVTLPQGYEVTVDGSDLAASQTAGEVVLESGEIDDPTAWLARIVATGPASYRTFTRAIPLAGGTVDLQVRAWADDEAWGRRTLDLLGRALPLLEARIGLPYPDIGPLVVVESVAGAEGLPGEPSAEGTTVQAGYDQPPFTVLHQVAHVWFSDRLASDRWMREGFASLAAAGISADLEVEPPYDPASRAEELAADAFPLVSWGAGPASEDQQAWAYAASWAVAAELERAVGHSRMQRSWQRIVAGRGPYEPVADEPPESEALTFPAVPAGSRQLLDQLETVSGADLAAIFERAVLDDETAAQLPQRAQARSAYAELLAAAGSWGAPDPVKTDLAAWRFDSALQRMSATIEWLRDRDALVAAAESAGLSVPSRLRDRYRTSGAGADARAELDAERAVVDAYAEVLAQSGRQAGFLERVGLLGGPDPSALLADAAALFDEGELRGAAESVEAARARLAQAETDGIVRLTATGAAVVLLLFLAWRIARRRRRARSTDYTAAP